MRRLIETTACLGLLVCFAGGCAAPHAARAGVENPVIRLQRNIAKVDRAIDATKRLLALAHSAPYVPDLYMRLAELYAEQSRYQYLIAYESNRQKNRAVVSIPARLLKEQAIQLYDRVSREFPEYRDLDKALFFKGHELRELGNYDEMVSTFERLVRDFPKSSFRPQALVVLGDYYFDRSNFPRAEEYYKRVLADPEGSQHAMARYKLGWSRQNQDDCKNALAYFEATARTAATAPGRSKSGGGDKGPASSDVESRKLDLRREALVDSGFCFTEVRKPEDVVPFYRALADTRSIYVAALSRLARRYHSKGQFRAAAPLYREILEVDPVHEDAIEYVQRFYEGLAKMPSPGTVDRDVEIIVRVAELRYFSPHTSETIRKAMIHDFEVYARDLSTKAQLHSKEQGDPLLLSQVASAYERYLSFFRDVAHVKEAQAIEANLADVLFAAKRHIAAGHAYEAVARQKGTPEAERKSALFSAAAAYTLALKHKLSNYEQVAARAGLYRAGRDYIAAFPNADNLPELKFNIANTLYEDGEFREAIARFTAIAEQYPKSREGAVSAQLALDSYRLLYDMEGLVRAGQRFLGDERLSDPALRRKLQDVVSAAQQRQLDVLTMSAAASDRGTDTLLSFAQKNVGSALGEKALLNAFMAAKDQSDLLQLIKIGDQILRDYPNARDSVSILGTLGKLTAQAAQFEEAARYLGEAAKRETQPGQAQEMVRTAAVLSAQRGDRKAAEDGLRALQQGGAPGALQTDVAQALGDLYRHSGDANALLELSKALPQAPAELRMDAIVAALAGGAPLDRFAGELRGLLGAGGETAALAKLFLADLSARQLDAITFTDKRTEDAKVIARRFAMANQVEAQYVAVVKEKRPREVLMALGRLHRLYQGGADFLASAPVPPGLLPADAQRYQAAFRSKAQPLLKKAEDALRTCAETAQQLRVFSATARACGAGQKPPEFEPLPAAVAPRPLQPEAPALRARLLKNPSDADALLKLGLLHLKAGDVYGAKLVADRAIEIAGPAQSAAHNLAGYLSYQLGEPAEAQRQFQEALKLDKRNARARLNLANLYREYGYGKAATETLGGGDVPEDLQKDPTVIAPAAPAPAEPPPPQEKK